MVDKDLFERYEKALGANAALFSNAVRDLSDEVDGMDGGSMRAYLGDRYPALVRAYGTVAAEAAREFYETQRAISGGAKAFGEYEAVTSYPEWLDAESTVQVNAVSAGVGQAVGSAVYSFLEGRGTKSVMGCADSTFDFNMSRDRARSKWALVPHAGACSWCVMIGSRGFMYHSERSVGAQRHNRCKCTPVVDFDTKNPNLEGYDPGKLYEQYRASEESGETRFGQRRPSSGRSYEKRERRTVDAQKSHAQANRLIDYLEKAENVEDFKRRAIKVDEQWMKSKHTGHAYQELRARYIQLAREWGVDPNKRPVMSAAKNTSVEQLRMTGKETYSYYSSDEDRIRDWMRVVTLTPQKQYSGPNITNKTRAIEQTKDDMAILEPLLRQAESRGLIIYGKKIDSFLNDPNEGKDLFVHAALVRDGRAVEVLEEIQENKRKNIDTNIDGKLVEIKCPTSDGKSKNPLGFVKDNFYTAVEQFKKDPDANEREVRLLYCTRYCDVDEKLVVKELKKFAAKDYVASIEVLLKSGEFSTVK